MNGNQVNPKQNIATKARLRLWLRLVKLTRHIERDIRNNLRVEFETTMPRFDVMAALDRYRDGLKMQELSRALHVSNGNVTGIVETLVTSGHVRRINDPNDKRAFTVKLTPKGKKEFEAMAAEHAKWIDAMLSDLDDAEAATLDERLKFIDEKM